MISFLIVFLFLAPNSISQATATVDLTAGNWLSYEVLESSETENMFFGTSPTYTYFGNWSVVTNDTITYTVSSITEVSINGSLFLGNLSTNSTFTNVRNVDTAFGLSIGIKTWNGGFLANASNWSSIQSEIQSTNTTVEELSNFELSINDNILFYDVMKFNTVDYYGQNTTLCYHLASGILLKAITSFGFYELSIRLKTTDLVIEGYTKRVAMDISLVLMALLLIPSLKLIKTYINKEKR